jgi:hypothetical protein
MFTQKTPLLLRQLVIVTLVGQKLNSVEHKKPLIVTHYEQLFSHILGETQHPI